jgi:hypothetical protein
MLVTVPLSGKLINGEDLFARLDSKLLIALPAMLILFAFLFWFVKRTYKRVILKSERLIDEAKNQS